VVHRIMQAAFAEYQGALPVESGAHTETVDDVRRVMDGGGAVLAFDGDDAVGSARFTVEAEGLYVARVSVLPTHRRRGVASAMMRYLEHLTPTYGGTRVRIGVRNSLPSNVGLYRSLGYEVTSIAPHPRGPDRVYTMVKTSS
jgi:ribosomal protein S18 acetylase RimI-like enzyme